MFTALKSATIQINIRARRSISEETLLGVLRGLVDPKPWRYHIASLMTELPAANFLRLVAEQNLQKDVLENVCRSLPDPYCNACRMKIDAHMGTTAP